MARKQRVITGGSLFGVGISSSVSQTDAERMQGLVDLVDDKRAFSSLVNYADEDWSLVLQSLLYVRKTATEWGHLMDKKEGREYAKKLASTCREAMTVIEKDYPDHIKVAALVLCREYVKLWASRAVYDYNLDPPVNL